MMILSGAFPSRIPASTNHNQPNQNCRKHKKKIIGIHQRGHWIEMWFNRLLHLLYRNQGDRSNDWINKLNAEPTELGRKFDLRRVSSPIGYSSNDGSRHYWNNDGNGRITTLPDRNSTSTNIKVVMSATAPQCWQRL